MCVYIYTIYSHTARPHPQWLHRVSCRKKDVLVYRISCWKKFVYPYYQYYDCY